MLSRLRPPPARGQEKSWPRDSLRTRLVAVMVVAALPLAVLACVQAFDAGRPVALLAALVASGACLALGVLLAGLAADQAARDALLQAQQAETASRAKDEFIALLSHELRNPLGAISAASDVLDSAPADSETAVEARSIIARQARNLSHTMNDLLDVSRVMAGKIQLAQQPVDLAALAQRVQHTLLLTPAAAGRKVSCQLECAWTQGDVVRLEQIVGNLLANAFKFTPAGADVGLRVRREGDAALVEVRDCGEGPGIGLTLVRRLVELHGGTLGVEASSHGSSFTVRLRAIEPAPAANDDLLPLPRRCKVLVVQDNEDLLATLRAKLELEGHTVSTAASGPEGLSRLLALRPEVSIVDIGLPGIAGFELARNARAAGYAGRMIALSGDGQERDVANAMGAGFDACLVKPVDRRQLRASFGNG